LNKAVRVILATSAYCRFGQSSIDRGAGCPLGGISSSAECLGALDVSNLTVLNANDVLDQREVERASKLSKHECGSRECLGPRQSMTPPSRA